MKFSNYKEKTKNGKLKVDCWSAKNTKQPCDLAMQSHKKGWFECDICYHTFNASLDSIAGKHTWCPYCVSKLCNDEDCVYCYERSFANFQGKTKTEKLKVDCWSSKNTKIPRNTTRASGKKVWFDCDVCHHDFSMTLTGVVSNKWCPYCVTKLCGDVNCIYCHNRSFAGFRGKTKAGGLKRDCWSTSNTKQIRDMSRNSNTKFLFDCDVCYHNFSVSLNTIVTGGSWCPYCSANCRVCDDGECKHCFDKSFANFKGETRNGKLKVECWSTKNGKQPREYTLGSNKKVWFDCDNCPHSFNATMVQIKYTWCPYCSKPSKKRCATNCKYCYDTSFAPFQGKTKSGKLKVHCWSSKNTKKPSELSPGNMKKFWFDCDNCSHSFCTRLTNIINNKWCPKCRSSKGEKEVDTVIRDLGYRPKEQMKFPKCKNKRLLPFDNSIIGQLPLDILIEFDGVQHFTSKPFFGGAQGYEKRVKHDIIKNTFALEHNYVLLRISYKDITKVRKLITQAIDQSKNNASGIIYSNEQLYETCYLSSREHVN